MQQAPTNNSQMRTAAIVTIVVIIGLLLLGRFVTGMMSNDTTPTTTDTIDTTNNNNTLNPQTNNTNNSIDTSTLGPVVAAENIDRDNCAVGATTTFDRSDPVYVVLEDSQFAEGTSMFARLYKDNVAIEDTRELVAEEDYENVCVSFVFEATDSAEVWDTGSYEVEFYVNGRAYQSTSFQIR